MAMVKRFFREFGEIPGSLLLVVLVLWQVTVVQHSSDQAIIERHDFLEEMIVQICWRSESNVIVIENLMQESIQYNSRTKANESGPLYRMPKCERHTNDIPHGSGLSYTIPWSYMDIIGTSVQLWWAAAGVILFLCGLSVRLFLSQSPDDKKIAV